MLENIFEDESLLLEGHEESTDDVYNLNVSVAVLNTEKQELLVEFSVAVTARLNGKSLFLVLNRETMQIKSWFDKTRECKTSRYCNINRFGPSLGILH